VPVFVYYAYLAEEEGVVDVVCVFCETGGDVNKSLQRFVVLICNLLMCNVLSDV